MFNKIIRLCISICCVCLSVCFNTHANEFIKDFYIEDYSSSTDDEIPHFTLDGELGILVNTGNTSAASVKTAVNAEHETGSWSSLYFAELLYKESGTPTTERDISAQRFYSSAQFNFKLNSPEKRIFMYGDYEDDKFTGYDYRATVAAGWSQRVWADEYGEFKYSIGPGFKFLEVEEDNNDVVNDGAIVRASAEYLYNWSSGAKLRQFLSTEAGQENTKSRSETSISANVFGSLAMKLSFTLNHETDTVDDAKPLSTETSIALVYQFF